MRQADPVSLLGSLTEVPIGFLEKLREGMVNSRVFSDSDELRLTLNELLRRHDLAEITSSEVVSDETQSEEDIPF